MISLLIDVSVDFAIKNLIWFLPLRNFRRSEAALFAIADRRHVVKWKTARCLALWRQRTHSIVYLASTSVPVRKGFTQRLPTGSVGNRSGKVKQRSSTNTPLAPHQRDANRAQ